MTWQRGTWWGRGGRWLLGECQPEQRGLPPSSWVGQSKQVKGGSVRVMVQSLGRSFKLKGESA